MKVVVCIASFGTKNDAYLKFILNEYRRMPFEIRLVVLCDKDRFLGKDVEVKVGLPVKNPHSLPFAHKKVFADSLFENDLFIYSEDDMFITEENIRWFVKLSEMLPSDCIPGFIRYEIDSGGNKSFPEFHGRYHWVRNSVEVHGDEIFARFGNEHTAAYILTKAQLKKAIGSGGYLVQPHMGEYDLECSAATDPYTQCGFRRLLCVSRLSKILLHHMSNVYVGRIGITLEELQNQIDSLVSMSNGDKNSYELFPSRKKLSVRYWDKEFYEKVDHDIIDVLKGPNRRLLSVGCGYGDLEIAAKRIGHHVTGIPLDLIIGESLRWRGIEITNPCFDSALKELEGRIFDCVILCNVLQHVKEPEILLKRLMRLIDQSGILIIKVPNFNFFRWKAKRPHSYMESNLNCVNVNWLSKWITSNGFKLNLVAQGSEKVNCFFKLFGPVLCSRLARSFVVTGTR